MLYEVITYAGGFSATYGDRLSSVMDIALREGNRDEVDLQLDMNLAGVGAIADGPFADGKGSWLFAARKSLIEILFGITGEQGNVPAYDDFQGT